MSTSNPRRLPVPEHRGNPGVKGYHSASTLAKFILLPLTLDRHQKFHAICSLFATLFGHYWYRIQHAALQHNCHFR
jgi:hypothetical protein